MIIKNDAKKQLLHQLYSFFGSVELSDIQIIDKAHISTIDILEKSFKYIANKYYERKGEVFFNSLHVSQYTIYLYTISSQIYKLYPQAIDLCDKIYGVLKTVSSADIFYKIQLPEIWFCDHPQSAVIGRAKYSNYFSFSQGCTVGNNRGYYPCFDEHVTMFSNSKVLGRCRISDHVIFSANSYVIDTDIPPYSIVFGSYPNHIIHSITKDKFKELTDSIFKDI